MALDRVKKEPEYEEQFVLFSALVEKWMKRALYVLISLLVAMQLLLQIPGLRYYLVKVEQLEGIPYDHSR
ncbi:hypothetical protein GCM10023310_22520 [Paenibacillus vulneris]|uniref:Uncharacterized protein n=1 Tax=Paenibacillus vulneris TaxID=1133364 RepID=A0ABW3UDS2_9BACL